MDDDDVIEVEIRDDPPPLQPSPPPVDDEIDVEIVDELPPPPQSFEQHDHSMEASIHIS